MNIIGFFSSVEANLRVFFFEFQRNLVHFVIFNVFFPSAYKDYIVS